MEAARRTTPKPVSNPDWSHALPRPLVIPGVKLTRAIKQRLRNVKVMIKLVS